MLADAMPWVATWKAELRRRDTDALRYTAEERRAFERQLKKQRKDDRAIKPRFKF